MNMNIEFNRNSEEILIESESVAIKKDRIEHKTKKKPNRIFNLIRKYHKWAGLLCSLLVLNFAISGVILNHRELFSSIDLPRTLLPQDYHYYNWNNAAVKGAVNLDGNNQLIYGNIGIWKRNIENNKFIDFNNGLAKGMDNRNIHTIIKTEQGNIYAGTLTGFYKFNKTNERWEKIYLPTKEQRVVKIIENNNKIVLLTRSNVLISQDNPLNLQFKIKQLPAPAGYKSDIGLFQTLWQIHSGEAFGLVGRLFVDILALVFIFLTITGLIKWIGPKTYAHLRKSKEKIKDRKRFILKNLVLHNKVGVWFVAFLCITTLTGMFLRPPLLIFIADSKVPKLKFTALDQPNPWYDKLRNIIYDKDKQKYMIAVDDAIYESDNNFNYMRKYEYQPPFSVMGINVLEQKPNGYYLVGSFSGLFLWNPESGTIIDYVTNREHIDRNVLGPPIGANAVSGYSIDNLGREYYFDYDMGAVPLNSKQFYPQMNNEILQKSGISLWNTALEFHTGRIYKVFLNDFYILLVPFGGLSIFALLITGLIVWWKIYKGKDFQLLKK